MDTAFVLATALAYVGDDATDLLIADPDTRHLEIERVANPGHGRKLEQQADLAFVGALEHRRLGVEAEQSRCPPEVGLEDLSNVHTAGHAQRVEDNVDRTAVGEERHILLGDDTCNDTLVAVASSHLVADRDLSLLGHIDLHELNDARRQLVRLQHAVDSFFRLLLELGLLVVGQVDDGADALVHLLVLDPESLQVDRRHLHFAEHVGAEPGAGGNRFLDRSSLERQRHRLTVEQIQQLAVTHFVDADLLLALESANVTDSLATILLDDLVFDA